MIDSHSCRIMSKHAIFFRILGSERHVNALTVDRGRPDSLQECTYAEHICIRLHARPCLGKRCAKDPGGARPSTRKMRVR